DEIENEFKRLNLEHILDISEEQQHYIYLESQLSDHDTTENLKNCLRSIQISCKSFTSEVNEICEKFSKSISENKDIDFRYAFTGTLRNALSGIPEVRERIDVLKKD